MHIYISVPSYCTRSRYRVRVTPYIVTKSCTKHQLMMTLFQFYCCCSLLGVCLGWVLLSFLILARFHIVRLFWASLLLPQPCFAFQGVRCRVYTPSSPSPSPSSSSSPLCTSCYCCDFSFLLSYDRPDAFSGWTAHADRGAF